MNKYSAAFCLLLIAFPVSTKAVAADQTDRILANILDSNNYKVSVHPKGDDDGAVSVGMTIIPLHFAVDESASILHSHLWIGFSWNDDRLKWDKDSYENVSTVHASPDKIWKPDIKAFNSVDQEQYEPTDVILHSTGQAFWIPATNMHTSCDFKFKYWPWDTQSCVIVFGSWTKNGDELDLINLNHRNISHVSLVNYAPTIWDVTSAYARANKKYYSGIGEPWPDVTLHLTMRRVSFVDQKVAVLPLIVVCCLSLAAFWTFPLSKSRLTLGCLNIIILFLALLYLRSRLPMSGAEIPLIIGFCGSLLVLVTIQVLATLTITNLIARKDSPPRFMVTPFEGLVGRLLCLSDLPLVGKVPSYGSYTIDMEAMRIAAVNSAPPTQAQPSSDVGSNLAAARSNLTAGAHLSHELSEWNLLCQAMDRIMFALYFFIMLIFMGSYIGGAIAK